MRHRRPAWPAIVFAPLGFLLIGRQETAWGTTATSLYSFDLATANTTVAPTGGTMVSPGDWISVTGSGTFDAVSGKIAAGGSFVHYNANGTMHCRGTWKATAFTGFTDFGANDQGEEGGVLSMAVTHYCKTIGMTMTGIPMTVTSTVNAPAGSSYLQGTTACGFTIPTGGTVVIQPEQ